MAVKTVIKKSLISDIENSKISRPRAKKLSRAITEIDSVPVAKLCKSGKAKRIDTQHRDDLYMYRVGTHERIIFSVNGNRNIIHETIDADKIRALKQQTKNDKIT